MTNIVLSCALASAPVLGCGGNSAELTRDDGAVLIGRIVGADETRIWVNSVEPARRVVVRRDRLTDIDHPGDAGIIWGSVSTGLGALMMLPLLARDDESDGSDLFGLDFAPLFALSGAMLVALGIPLLIAGIADKSASKAAASPDAGAPAEPAPTIQVGLTGLRITF